MTILPGKSEAVSITLTLRCTSSVRHEFIIRQKDGSHAAVKIYAEGAPSCFLSAKQLQFGKKLGKGAYETFLFFHSSLLFLTTLIDSEQCLEVNIMEKQLPSSKSNVITSMTLRILQQSNKRS